MGGAVSSGESNDELVDNLLSAEYIKSPVIESVFRAVDRGFYFTKPFRHNAYKDLAWKDGNLHISAPCIYSEVMESLKLTAGMSFLNIGSGTGYLSTIVGLVIGRTGINHGIEIHSDVVDYARVKLEAFIKSSPAVDIFDFCPPEFVVGNYLDALPTTGRYDRIYCGAACARENARLIVSLLKIGGLCIVPMNDSLVQVTRCSETKVDTKTLLSVSFASLIPSSRETKVPVSLPSWNPPRMSDICRSVIRQFLRETLEAIPVTTKIIIPKDSRKRRRKRCTRRNKNRMLLVRRHRDRATPPTRNRASRLVLERNRGSPSCEEPNQNEQDASSINQNNHSPKLVEENDHDSGADSGVVQQDVDAPSSSSGSPARSQGQDPEACNENPEDDAEHALVPLVESRSRNVSILERIRAIIQERRLDRPGRMRNFGFQFAESIQVTDGEGESSDTTSEDEEMDHEYLWNPESSDDGTSTLSSSTGTDEEDDGNGHGQERHEIDISAIGVDLPVRHIFGAVNFVGSDDDDTLDGMINMNHPTPNPTESTEKSNIEIEIDAIRVETSRPPSHPTSLQLMTKIQTLNLPPPIKKFLNYDRQFSSTF